MIAHYRAEKKKTRPSGAPSVEDLLGDDTVGGGVHHEAVPGPGDARHLANRPPLSPFWGGVSTNEILNL